MYPIVIYIYICVHIYVYIYICIYICIGPYMVVYPWWIYQVASHEVLLRAPAGGRSDLQFMTILISKIGEQTWCVYIYMYMYIYV